MGVSDQSKDYTMDDFHCAWHRFKNDLLEPIANEAPKITADASTAVAAETLALMTKASSAMLQNTTLNGNTVIADSTKAKAAITAATAFCEKCIRTKLNYIERNKVPHDHHFANYSIDRYRNYGYTVTTKMEGAHSGHIKIFLAAERVQRSLMCI